MGKVPFFSNVVEARFVRRLNRFAVECSLDDNMIQAHLPNPGRLWELLLPGKTVFLTAHDASQGRSTGYTAVAVERNGVPVLLHTQMANTVVKTLLEQNKVPGLENAEIIRQEAPFGKSRFDFLLRKGDETIVLEVKSCTLFGKHMAMFPDAITARGRKHLLKLADLASEGMTCRVIFLVHAPHARYFLPDYHTDISFSRTFLDVRDTVLFMALGVTWNKDLSLGEAAREIEIPWHFIGREAEDRGSYLLILHISDDLEISVGRLGPMSFPTGYYLYVGSAKTNLTKRMERHIRKRKTFFWHIDYLRDRADTCVALPIRSSVFLEHEIAHAISGMAGWSIPGFGSSDCSCPTHLFAMRENPIQCPAFIDFLQHFRMDRWGAELR